MILKSWVPNVDGDDTISKRIERDNFTPSPLGRQTRWCRLFLEFCTRILCNSLTSTIPSCLLSKPMYYCSRHRTEKVLYFFFIYRGTIWYCTRWIFFDTLLGSPMTTLDPNFSVDVEASFLFICFSLWKHETLFLLQNIWIFVLPHPPRLLKLDKKTPFQQKNIVYPLNIHIIITPYYEFYP